VKKITDYLDVGDSKLDKVAEEHAAYQTLTNKEIEKKISEIEHRMYEHARNLEFEDAAKCRDDIDKLNTVVLSR
jgi:excinuclease ABC subunit B